MFLDISGDISGDHRGARAEGEDLCDEDRTACRIKAFSTSRREGDGSTGDAHADGEGDAVLQVEFVDFDFDETGEPQGLEDWVWLDCCCCCCCRGRAG